ncbi:uncharacterized protein LOC143573883 [Bidens hawaiensis]|uniref:uncharacterized protein LOC143573883 n=1 Tax=Bidens hawaiensis TaxID=980011 RepID=UPI00404A91E2
MVNNGVFKSDNGFKSGYLQHLEASLKESLPESGILGKPHIESRIVTMKRYWQVVYDMLNTSGFGYDKKLNCVTTSAPGVLETFLERHKHAAKWRHKRLPFYEELCVVFGNERAKGNRAKNVVEKKQEVNMKEEEEEHQEDDYFSEHSYNEGTDASFQVKETSSDRSKKRKRTSQVNTLFKSFNDAVVLFGHRLKETSAELNEDMKFELDIKKKALMVTTELSKMTYLTQLKGLGKMIK